MLAAVDCSVYGTCTSPAVYGASYLAGYLTFYAVLTVVSVWICVRIARKAGWSPWLGILGVLPIVSLVAILVFAFKEWPVEAEVRELRGRLAMAQATAVASRAGAPAVSRFGTPPPPSGTGFSSALAAQPAPGFGAPGPFGAAPTYGAAPLPPDPTAVYGGQPAYAAQPSFSAPPAAPSRFGTPPPPETSRFGTPPPPQPPSRFGTPPPPGVDAQQPHNPWQPPEQQPPQRW